MNATMRLSCGVWLAAMLAGCTSAPSKPEAVAHMIQPQRVTEHRGHDDLLTAQADQAQAWFRLYRSLGGGWNAEPNPTDQLAAQP